MIKIRSLARDSLFSFRERLREYMSAKRGLQARLREKELSPLPLSLSLVADDSVKADGLGLNLLRTWRNLW